VSDRTQLLDEQLPRWDVSEYHETRVAAAPARTWAAIREADLAASVVVKALLVLRSLPSLLADPGAFPGATRFTLDEALRHGFRLLAEAPGREVVIGVTGSFWRPTGNIATTDPARFREPVPPGMARAAWNFVVAEADGGSLLTTETRVLCADEASRRSFRRYWRLVGPFSGLIRHRMLASIRATAEAPRARP
jgi:hypothetical protein